VNPKDFEPYLGKPVIVRGAYTPICIGVLQRTPVSSYDFVVHDGRDHFLVC